MHVLIIERDLDIRDLLHQALIHAGYEVSLASNLADGLRLSQLDPEIRLVLADLRTDQPMYGMDIAKEMRQRLNCHCIFATGDWDVLQTDDAGDISILRKPYGKAELLRAIRQAIASHEARRPPGAHRRRRGRPAQCDLPSQIVPAYA